MSFEIDLGQPVETGGCTCTGCQFGEWARGHAAVAEMRGHAVMHAITTGHRVDEHAETTRTIRPLSSTDY